MKHDHVIQCNGFDMGFPMWDIVCLHEEKDDLFYRWEFEGETGREDTCLVQQWWLEVGTDLVHSTDAHYHPPIPGLRVVTTYDIDGEPLLRSLANAKEWKEGEQY